MDRWRERWERWRPGVRAGAPFAIAAAVLGVSFGVLAEPVMGAVATVAMSAIVFAGAAQFAAVAVLAAGGDPATAIVAGTLINARYIPMSIAFGPATTGGVVKRAAQGWAIVDASWALANRGGGRFDRDMLLGATLIQYPCWIGGTALGVIGGDLVADPATLGLDALFPAFFLGLLAEELRSGQAVAAAVVAAAIALALTPFTPPGIPILAASAAVLIGVRR